MKIIKFKDMDNSTKVWITCIFIICLMGFTSISFEFGHNYGTGAIMLDVFFVIMLLLNIVPKRKSKKVNQ